MRGNLETLAFLKETLPPLLIGAWVTIEITVVSLFVALILGLILGLMRISTSRVLRGLAASYVNLIRGLPLLVQILFVYFGIPLLLGVRIPALTAGIITISLYSAAYLAEIFRAGIESIDTGQMEGGRSIGFSYWQTMRMIVLPQAIWRMIPAFANQFSSTLKDTSLLSVIGVGELTMSGQNIYAVNFETVRVLTVVGTIYLIIVLLAVRLSRYLELRFNS